MTKHLILFILSVNLSFGQCLLKSRNDVAEVAKIRGFKQVYSSKERVCYRGIINTWGETGDGCIECFFFSKEDICYKFNITTPNVRDYDFMTDSYTDTLYNYKVDSGYVSKFLPEKTYIQKLNDRYVFTTLPYR